MKIYCYCSSCNNKIYLSSTEQTRQQLANNRGDYFSINCIICQSTNEVQVNSVNAETSRGNTPYATGTGSGLVGAIAGPIGAVIGLIVGGIAGTIALSQDKEAVNRFNSNFI
jgi:outer membrane lipoprotein SlyB